MTHCDSAFDGFSRWVAQFAGHPVAFAAAVALIGLRLIGGPLVGFSDTWQLLINKVRAAFELLDLSESCSTCSA